MANNLFNGLVNSNWRTAGNWSLVLVPTASDGNVARFDATSPACTSDTGSNVCNAIDFTGYTNTITMTQQITSSGSITLASGMTIAGSGALICNATATLTSNGKVWPNPFTANGTTPTFTLSDPWNVDGLLTLASSSGTTTLNGFSITASAGFTQGTTTGIVAGTTNLILDGTGTITGAGSTGALRLNLTLNTAGTLTFAAAPFSYNTGTLTYTAGTIITTGSTLDNKVVDVTLATSGMIWDKVTLAGTVTVTLSSNLTLTGLLLLGATAGDIILNGSQIDASGGIRFNGTTGSCYGTTILNVTSTSTLDAPNITTGEGIDNPIVINAPGGTVTVSSGFRCNLGKLSYIAGTVIAGNTWVTGTVTGTASGSFLKSGSGRAATY